MRMGESGTWVSWVSWDFRQLVLLLQHKRPPPSLVPSPSLIHDQDIVYYLHVSSLIGTYPHVGEVGTVAGVDDTIIY